MTDLQLTIQVPPTPYAKNSARNYTDVQQYDAPDLGKVADLHLFAVSSWVWVGLITAFVLFAVALIARRA